MVTQMSELLPNARVLLITSLLPKDAESLGIFLRKIQHAVAQEERAKRRHDMSNRIRTKARTYSLSGLMWCKHCGSKVHIHQNSIGKPRVYCGSKARGFDCRSRILEAHRKLETAYDDTIKRRDMLGRRLEKVKDMYKWGHMSKDEYLADYGEIQKELKMLTVPDDKGKTLEKLAHFLANVADAWEEGTQEQRIWNKINQMQTEPVRKSLDKSRKGIIMR